MFLTESILLAPLLSHQIFICVEVRVPNMGKELIKRTRSRGSKLPLVITRGGTRLTSALISAKFVSECNIAVRNHIRVYTHSKKYRQDPELMCDFYGKMTVFTNCIPLPLFTVYKAFISHKFSFLCMLG
jgi:hypothetical protein